MNTELYRLKLLCRWALGLVWIWEGLVLKILFRHDVPMQAALIERSGMYWPDADTFTIILGAAMTLCGIILCSGWKERAVVLTATTGMTVLIFLVAGNNPVSILDMHGGLAKDLCLYACAWVVWRLAAPHTDCVITSASRARGEIGAGRQSKSIAG